MRRCYTRAACRFYAAERHLCFQLRCREMPYINGSAFTRFLMLLRRDFEDVILDEMAHILTSPLGLILPRY